VEDRQLTRCAERARRTSTRALRVACLLACLPPPASAEPVDRNPFHRQVVEQFSALDGDRDGRLQPADVVDLSPERFQAADADHDGALTLVEYVDARFEEIEAVAAPPAEAAQPEGAAPAVEPGPRSEPAP
jgi:hypothetical protein